MKSFDFGNIKESLISIARSQLENGLYYDPTYKTYFTEEQLVRSFDILFEQMEKWNVSVFATPDDFDSKETQMQYLTEISDRFLEEGIISEDIYSESLKNYRQVVYA